MKRISIRTQRRAPFITGLLLGVLSLVGFAYSLVGTAVAAQDCDNNAVIHCGVTSVKDFVSTAQSNDNRNGQHDLHSLYAYHGLPKDQYDEFAAKARPGTVYKDGRIVVDGKVVARDAKSIGRQRIAASDFSEQVAGKSFYGNSTGVRFNSDSLPIYALLNSMGELQFAVITSCGNPTFGTVVKNSASCTMLNRTAVAGQLNTYDYTASAAASGNASITKYVYDFGDGTPTVTTTDGSKAVRHTYAKGGTFTAKVTVFASVPGNGNLQLPVVGTCTKVVTVAIPFYTCAQLTGAILDKSKFKYSFTAKANYGNGATLVSGDFTFGDGTTAKGVKPTKTGEVTVEHAYAQAGTYNASAMLYFTVNGKTVSSTNACPASITPDQPPTPTCKPGVPVGSPECTPCQYDASLPSNSPQCVPPVLPNTGAGNVVAIFGMIVVGGFMVYRHMVFRKHKAAFAAAELGTSALPLADPMSDTPLVGTPLQPQRSSRFRRKRQF